MTRKVIKNKPQQKSCEETEKNKKTQKEDINFYKFIENHMYITIASKVGYNIDIDEPQKTCMQKYYKMPQSFNFELCNLEKIYNDIYTIYYFNTDLSNDEKRILLRYMFKCIELINKYYNCL